METTRKLYRSCDDKIVGGVAGGLAEYLEVDPLIVRLLFLVVLFAGIGFAAYIVAWVIIPENPKCKGGKTGAEEIQEKANSIASTFKGKKSEEDSDFKVIFGLVLLALGMLLLFQNFVGQYVWKVFWPMILVLVGLYLMTKSK